MSAAGRRRRAPREPRSHPSFPFRKGGSSTSKMRGGLSAPSARSPAYTFHSVRGSSSAEPSSRSCLVLPPSRSPRRSPCRVRTQAPRGLHARARTYSNSSHDPAQGRTCCARAFLRSTGSQAHREQVAFKRTECSRGSPLGLRNSKAYPF